MYKLYRSSKKSGKVDLNLESQSLAMLKLWGLQNTTKTKQCHIVDADNKVIVIYEGADFCPKVITPVDMVMENVG